MSASSRSDDEANGPVRPASASGPYREPGPPPPLGTPPDEPSFAFVATVLIILAILVYAFRQPSPSDRGFERRPSSTAQEPQLRPRAPMGHGRGH